MAQRRQRIRRAIQLVTFLTFPAILFYFSPVIIVMAAAEGIIAGSAIVFATQFLGSLFFGRLFCGWMCAAAGLQAACETVTEKPANRRFSWIKYAIWTPWIMLIALMALRSPGFTGLDFFYQTTSGISVADPHAYIIYFIVTGIIAALTISLGRRAFCHFGCWMAPFMILGTALSDKISLPRLRLHCDKDKCTECKRCTKTCPMSLPVMDMVRSESMDHHECTLCGNCIDNCTKNAIRYAFAKPATKNPRSEPELRN